MPLEETHTHLYTMSFLVESHVADPAQVLQGEILEGLRKQVAYLEKHILDLKEYCVHTDKLLKI